MGTYIRLVNFSSPEEKEVEFLKKSKIYITDMKDFKSIEGVPFTYWLSKRTRYIFQNEKSLSDYGDARIGLQTGDTAKFIRLWYEVDQNLLRRKWFPINKGGHYRKWFGNNLQIVDWENDGQNIKADKARRLEAGLIEKKNSKCWNEEYYFKKGITWNLISSSAFSARCYDNMIFDIASNGYFIKDDSLYLYMAGLLNSVVVEYIANALNPTMNLSAGVLSKLPIIVNPTEKDKVIKKVEDNIDLSREEWDSFEESPDFLRDKLIIGAEEMTLIEDNYKKWEQKCEMRFAELKQNEEELNRIFIDMYGLNGELTAEVSDDLISVRKANLEREIKSLISYAVGCIMGRYSLKEDGLIYAGGTWDASRYSDEFKPCEYGVMLITEDQYFEEDLCTRVIDFIEVVYGKDTLNENLNFIAKALKPGYKESARQVLRNYLYDEKGFFDNHYQVYQHRPIYWMMSSGKNGGFRAIVYMHRYDQNTLSIVRSDFLHELRYKYEADQSLQHKKEVEAATTADRNDAKKKIAALDKKMVEVNQYDDLINHATGNITAFTFDLDDGVKTNYSKFLNIDGVKTQNLLVPIKL